jgi:hypothetical protein
MADVEAGVSKWIKSDISGAIRYRTAKTRFPLLDAGLGLAGLALGLVGADPVRSRPARRLRRV